MTLAACEPANLSVADVFASLPRLETKRLLLREITLADKDDLLEFASDPRVSAYTSWRSPGCAEECEQYISSVMEQYAASQLAPWGVIHKADAKLIGMVEFVTWAPRHARAEVQGLAAPKYWGRGYAIEALREAVRFGFETMRVNRIEALCRTDNAPAGYVLEKVGMKLEGVLREHVFAGGAFRDANVYAIVSSDWGGTFHQGSNSQGA